MPVGLDGLWNLAALQVPGVYVDIIPPSPFLVGSPTNKGGLVGVASWGAVNAVTQVQGSTDCAYLLGTPKIRSHDIATIVAAAAQVAGAASYQCIRVTDGTDTAASGTVQSTCLTLTAKYTGTLGNSISITMANGTAVGSYMATINFPGAPAEQFNNIGTGVGAVTVTAGTGYTSVPAISLSTTYTSSTNALNVAPVINPTLTVVSAAVTTGGTSGFAVNDLLYFNNGIVLKVATVSTGVVSTVTVATGGGGTVTGGAVPSNPMSMTSTSGSGVGTPTIAMTWGMGAPIIVNPGFNVSACSITLTGGGGSSGAYSAAISVWLNLANAINLGNATRAKSNFVVATAGTGTATPTLSSPVTLTGGTDGAAAVTDATLIGSDVFPRTGMYALRGLGTQSFALIDLLTPSYWPSMDSFALSENTLSCVATVSGDTIANAAATRVSVGLDDMWTWIAVGDWPTFYDATNGLSRTVNPQAYQVAIVCNQSPEHSPLNKILRGISATQRTQSGQPYGFNTDLQTLNTSGIDVILGPPNTVGGNYFAFGSGRNASSNTAANGVEWTTLTNFLARTANQYAVGQIVGQLQSIQPNDQTRANAKALFDGFSAQLANPNSGSNGHGIIDTWSTQCDLNNNPPSSQARGYLFITWVVRYLNTVRYIVVRLAGGGNVTVTTQSTVPTPAQYQ